MTDDASVPELVPVRMVNEFTYCPRLFYLEWVQGEWAENYYTEDGRFAHRRADKPTAGPPPSAEPRDFTCRSVAASSTRLGLSTRVDVLEGEGGVVSPVEYKRGSPPDVPDRAWPPERVQVCAQALILRDNGYRVDQGFLYFAASKERVPVLLDEALVRETEAAIEGLRRTAAVGVLPPPLVDSPKCDGCSLAPICLPDEVNLLSHADGEGRDGLRQLHPRRDDKLPVYVQRGGHKIGVAGDVLEIRDKGATVAEARLETTSQVSVFGGVQVSTQALNRLFERDIPVAYFTAGGWFHGWAHGLGSKNVELRRAQFRIAEDPVASLGLARRIVAHEHREPADDPPAKPPQPRECPRPAERPLEERRDDRERRVPTRIEGTAARLYFESLPALFKVDLGELSFDGRNRRPAARSRQCAPVIRLRAPREGLDDHLRRSGLRSDSSASTTVPAMAVPRSRWISWRSSVRSSPTRSSSSIVNTGSIGLDDFYRSGLGVALKDGARARLHRPLTSGAWTSS